MIETTSLLSRFARVPLVATFLGAMLLAQSCAMHSSHEAPMAPESYRAVIENPLRTDQDRTMDARRHPAELLAFAQVRPGMRVLDIAAGGGYTAQLLTLAVGADGVVWAQAPTPGPAITKRLADRPQANLRVMKRTFEDPVPEEATNLDLVTLVLNYHDISYLPVDRAKMNQRIFAALKPGGRYVVVDHAAVAGSGITAGKTLHRIEEAVVIAEARQAGFVLDGEGKFLRNPQDDRTATSNRPDSDRFVMRFVKPR